MKSVWSQPILLWEALKYKKLSECHVRYAGIDHNLIFLKETISVFILGKSKVLCTLRMGHLLILTLRKVNKTILDFINIHQYGWYFW